ncbi:hypothetical protein SELMODRAFT_413957 [Selaginella moellendorffii]|uniref:Uncharacterized protein n=1 Tax=Selaginella moellendorffii TaxID=88036 RepID=D8RR62_SELML|nr:hypothetical protein SELMODRAFT_413957 [Selaginella moellendorffii]
MVTISSQELFKFLEELVPRREMMDFRMYPKVFFEEGLLWSFLFVRFIMPPGAPETLFHPTKWACELSAAITVPVFQWVVVRDLELDSAHSRRRSSTEATMSPAL